MIEFTKEFTNLVEKKKLAYYALNVAIHCYWTYALLGLVDDP